MFERLRHTRSGYREIAKKVYELEKIITDLRVFFLDAPLDDDFAVNLSSDAADACVDVEDALRKLYHVTHR